jgi:ubiquitin-activating enzyme E1
MPSEEPLNKRVRTDMNNETTFELDLNTLNKFSRQNATFGAETTAKLIKMKVIVYGLRGIGAETSKNLALQGVGSITLIDSAPVDIKDLGVNFFYSESDVTSGVSRAETFSIKLKELNPLCDVKVCSHLSPEILAKHTALVICNPTIQKSELINFNEACRKLGTSFFYAFTGGLFTSIFVDHGEKHIVNDPDGEKPLQKLITSITSAENTNEFLIRYDTPEGQVPISIDSGTFKISDIMGFDQLNGKIVSCSHPSSDPVKTVRAIIEGVSDISNCNISGGLLTEEKVPKAYPMLSLADKIKNPGSPFTNDMVMTDLLTFSEQQIHVSFVAVMTYYELHGRYPNKSDVDEVFKLAKELISSGQIALEQFEVDEAICKKVTSYSGFELQPLSAFVGGILAQEVVKCTGKFTPIPVNLIFIF